MMVSSRLLRKSEKSSPSLVLRNSTPWFFAAICFLWASFLTVAMLSNEQSLESNREQMRREVEERVMNELVKREKRKEEKIPSLASEYHRREDEEDDDEEKEKVDEDKRRNRRMRGPLAGAYRRNVGHGLEEDQVGVQERKVQGPKFRGPFGRLESLIHEKAREKREAYEMKKKLQMEHEENERTRQELDAHLEDTDGKEKPRDTLDVEEKIQEALDGAIEREKSHDEDEDEDEKRRRLIETGSGESVVPTTIETETPETFPKSVYGQAHLLRDVPGFPKTPPLVLSKVKPKAYLFRNFLTEDECDHLMKLAKAELAPSTVVGSGGTSVPSTIRTSAGMFLRKAADKTLEDIEYRIAAASGTPEPNGEGMQILRYDTGQKYDPHFDYFHDAVNPSPKRGGQRMATMLIYLENTEEGGETIFPRGTRADTFDLPEEGNPHEWSDCTKTGLPVKSVKGDALLFWSLTEDYKLDMGSLHGACPVIKGQKWTAVKWIRVAKFDGMFTEPLPMPALSRRTEQHGKCVDEWDECTEWAKDGWCEKNKEFMISKAGARDSKGPGCPVSCDVPCN